MTLQIVLATFNGERWLPTQLASIAGQTRQDWRLLARDDGSSDATQRLLEREARADCRIELAPAAGEEKRGAAGNFACLLEQLRLPAETPVFLADQDDYWYPSKLERLSGLLQGSLLAFSDARLVDDRGAVTGTLFEALSVENEPSLREVLAANPAAGCTMAFRAELLELALPMPESVENHDWWLLVCALCAGSVAVCREPLIDYRQHGANTVGAAGGFRRVGQLPRLLRRQRRVLLGKPKAIRELVSRLDASGRPVPAELSAYLAAFDGRPPWRRALTLLRGVHAPRPRALRLLQVLALLLPLRRGSVP